MNSKKNNLFLLLAMTFLALSTSAQNSLEINGYADTYWKYDFAERENISTYFANDHNSISLGMLALGINAQSGKASFVGELSFGPRGQYLSLPSGDQRDPDNSFHIQNLHVSYNFTEDFSMTAGYMSTFIGYEVISPASNFHYSTSYLFGAGPFQNAGIKATYALSDKYTVMAGLFNDWNIYQDLNRLSHFDAQLSAAPTPSLTTYLNFMIGTSAGGRAMYRSGTLFDMVANYSISDQVMVGLNAADYTMASAGGYQGIALYPRYSFTENIAIGIRGEYFRTKETSESPEEKFMTATLSANLKHGGLTLIPEVRLDNNKQSVFLNKSDEPSRNTAQASLALAYAF